MGQYAENSRERSALRIFRENTFNGGIHLLLAFEYHSIMLFYYKMNHIDTSNSHNINWMT